MTLADTPILYPQHLEVMQTRAEVALARGGLEHLVIPSGTLHYQFFDDRDYPYAVNPQFKAWVPLMHNPGSWLVYSPGSKPRLIYLQPMDYWHVVPQAPSGYWTEHFDIQVIRKPEDAMAYLPSNPGTCAILGEPQSALGADNSAHDLSYLPNNPAAVIDYLEYHRASKTAYEIAMMREATRRGVRGHRAAERAFRAGASEFGIHLAYCQAAGQDSLDLPYSNIVALNEHGAVLHYTDRDRLAPTPVRSFLIDAGASAAGYASDITRTYAADPRSEFQSMIDAVDAAQQRLCASVQPGTDYKRIHLDAHLEMATILRDFRIIDMTPESALETGVSAAFFPHGIGHYIGLQVHDVGGFLESDSGGSIPRPEGHPYLRMTRVLEPGAVVTIEPGIYFIDLLLEQLRNGEYANSVDWSRVEAFHPYGGIRIEDDVICTGGNPVNLTREGFAENT